MNQLPLAVRATAAALAVFMTTATLNCMISIAEPQQSELIAQIAARQATQASAKPQEATLLAQAAAATVRR